MLVFVKFINTFSFPFVVGREAKDYWLKHILLGGLILKKKIKGLMPSLKEKKRYLAVKVEFVDTSDNNRLLGRPLHELVEKIRIFLGFKGASEAGLLPVSFANGVAIIRVSHNYLDEVRASLLFIRELASCKVILRSLKASGMINKVKFL